MESTGALLIPASCETERGVPTSHEIPPLSLIGVVLPAVVAVDHYLINTPSAALKGIRFSSFHSDHCSNVYQCHRCGHRWASGKGGRHSVVGKVRTTRANILPASECSRLVADTLRDSIAGLRKDEEARASQYAHSKLSSWPALTWYCHRFTDTLRELSAVREREEKGIARLVFPQISNGACSD